MPCRRTGSVRWFWEEERNCLEASELSWNTSRVSMVLAARQPSGALATSFGRRLPEKRGSPAVKNTPSRAKLLTKTQCRGKHLRTGPHSLRRSLLLSLPNEVLTNLQFAGRHGVLSRRSRTTEHLIFGLPFGFSFRDHVVRNLFQSCHHGKRIERGVTCPAPRCHQKSTRAFSARLPRQSAFTERLMSIKLTTQRHC